MKRRILPMIMAIMMILSIIQVPAWAADGDDPMETADSNELTDAGGDDSNEGEPETQDGNNVAQIGDAGYPTLQEAITAATDGQTVTLLTTVTESVTVEAGKNITLNLNGQTLQDSAEARNGDVSGRQHTIINKGTLTITGSGTVDNKSHACAALYNDVGGVVVLNGGNYTRSAENGQNVNNSGGNSYYNILNHGTMTINDGVLVEQSGHYSSMVENGYSSGGNNDPQLTINGGTFSGGLNTIKNDDRGTLEINDGTFTNVTQSAVMNWNKAKITGGMFESVGDGCSVLINTFYENSGHDLGQLEITGGTFSCDGPLVGFGLGGATHGTVTISGGIFTYNGTFYATSSTNTTSISGGTFSGDVSDYLAEGVDLIANNDGTYSVGELDASNAVAEIDGQYYGTLGEAFADVETNQTIVVLKNLTTAEKIRIETGESIILDLNGNTVTSSADSQFITLNGQGTELTITDNSAAADGRIVLETAKGGTAAKVGFCIFQGTLNIEKGTIESNGYFQDGDDYWGQMIVYMFGSNEDAANYSQFTLGEDATIVSTRAAEDGKVVNPGYAVSLIQRSSLGTQYGDVAYGANIDIYGETDNAILYVNGTVKATDGNTPSVTVHDGAYIDGGIYAAGYAKYEISGTVVGETGIEIRAGELIVNEGSVITGTATPTEVEPNGNGGTTLGAGVAIAQHTTKLPIKVTINGGTISGFSALYESNPQENTDEDIEKVEIIVSGGTFNATNGGTLAVYSENKTEFISGGTFSSDPSAYVAPGKIALVQNNGMYTIETASENVAEVVAGEPAVELGDGVPQGQQGAVKTAVEGIEAAGLTGEANSEANNNTVTAEQGKNALTSAGVTVDTCDTVTIVVQPYLDIEVNAYEADSSDTTTPNTMTLDITPMVRTVATTADVDQGGEIYLETEGDNTQNAVVVETAKELNVRGSITLTIPLPDGFANAGETVYIQHKDIYEYTATVENGGGLHITFVNPHGFSVFTLSTTSAAVAEVDGTSYTSFQAAVDAVENDGTITLMQDNPGTAVVNRAVAFDVETNSHTFNRNSITAASGYTLSGSGNHFVVTRTPVTPDDDDDSSSSGSSSSVRRYDIEADAGRGGDISPDGRVRVRRGENQTFRITADDGYEIYDVEVDGESVGAVSRYTFENVREDHTISATFRQTGAQTEEAQLPFLDVAEGAWYYDAVTYCYENGIMDGTSSVSFAPGMLLNRAMAAQVLYNLADGTASTAAGFPDVAASAWYADAVNWAAANGYVTGYDNGSFGPEDSLTREQLAVILYRYAGSPEPTGSLDGFTDAASASDYAVDALRWAVGEGLLTGKDGGRLDPAGTASRAELAQILARFAQM